MLDFRSKGPGFESLGYRSVGLSRLTLALALEVGSLTRLRSPYIPQKFKARPMQMKYMIGLNTHKTKQNVLGLNRTIRVGAGLTEMKRLGVAALQLLLTFSNKVHLVNICAERLEMFP